MRLAQVFWAFAALEIASPATAADFEGPGRFCGYAAVIDLLAGESIEPSYAGMHGQGFVWQGEFGELEIDNTGPGRRPEGRVQRTRTAAGQTLIRESRAQDQPQDDQGLVIWNRRTGVAFIRSSKPLTPAQLAAIDRISLVDEHGPTPEGCAFSFAFMLDKQ